MDDNIKSNKRSVVETQASINAQYNSNSISGIRKSRMILNDVGDRNTVQVAIWTVYVFLFQYKI
jgi:hypothetical protein